MSSSGLSMLYELLVSESKYESRGVEYRSRLRSLYGQMLREHELHHEPVYKLTKQCSNKYIESLSESVRVLDPTEVQSTDLELCYGVHQYVFPKIPDFTALDFQFLDKWNKFYSALPTQSKQAERRIKRTTEKQKTYQMIKRRFVRDSDSSSESDESNVKSNEPVVITEADFCPPDSNRIQSINTNDDINVEVVVVTNPHTDDITEDLDTKLDSEDPDGESDPLCDSEDVVDSNIVIPMTINNEVEITDESIVFGLMDEEKLNDWVSTTTFDHYLQLFKLIYHCDNSIQSSDLTELDSVDSVDMSKNEKISCLSQNTVSSSSSSLDDVMIGINDFYRKSKVEVIPGNYTHNPDHFDPNSIYGNYYLPPYNINNSINTSNTISQVNQGNQVSQVDPVDPVDTVDQVDPADPVDPLELDAINLMSLKSYSINFMEVNTNYYYSSTGLFESHCNAVIREPFISRIMQGNIETTTGLYQELQLLLKKLFSLKRKITGNCSVCSGWNLLHGIATTFCEYCEDKLTNSDPTLLLSMYEIRRYLVSTVYPIVGYTYNTVNLFNSGELVKEWKKELKDQKVSIQSLISIGATYPKASLHDSRTLPNPTFLPINICHTINTFQFPKSNTIDSVDVEDSMDSVDPVDTVDHMSSVNLVDSMDSVDSIENVVEMINENLEEKSEVTTPNNYVYSTSETINYTPNSTNTSSINSINSINSVSSVNSTTTSVSSVMYSLMEMVNYRRCYRGKLLNNFFEAIFNSYHSKLTSQRSNLLTNHYNFILKSGLLPSKSYNTIETTTDNTINSVNNTINSVNSTTSSVGKDENRDVEDVREYFDDNVSYVLSRLPLDTDLIKLSFYHRGIYLSKSNPLKTLNFLNIGKISGFNHTNSINSTNPLNSVNTVSSSSANSVNSNMENSINNIDMENDEVVEVVESVESVDSVDSVDLGGDSMGDSMGDVMYNYNWHEMLYRNLHKEQYINSNNTTTNQILISSITNQLTNSNTIDNGNSNGTGNGNGNLLEEMCEKELLQNMPTPVLKNFITTRKVRIGYPTSLEMYMLNIPDSIMDSSMYDGIGKGFSYSLENVIYNLALLSSFIRIGTVNKRKKIK